MNRFFTFDFLSLLSLVRYSRLGILASFKDRAFISLVKLARMPSRKLTILRSQTAFFGVGSFWACWVFLLCVFVCVRPACQPLSLFWFLGVLARTLFTVLFVFLGVCVCVLLGRCFHPAWLSRVFAWPCSAVVSASRRGVPPKGGTNFLG